MRDLTETAEENLDLPSLNCLHRTRSGVLNVLVGVGTVVALTGILLRPRAAGFLDPVPDRLSEIIFLGLFIVFVASTVTRRTLGRRDRLRDPLRRNERFFLGHVLPAVVGAMAAPLGLAHGWLISPRLESI